MKWSAIDRASLFLAAGLFILAYMNMRSGHNTVGVLWSLGAFGCCISVYAVRRAKNTKKKKNRFSLFHQIENRFSGKQNKNQSR